MLLKKINPNWNPIEKPDLKVGETIEKTDYRKLVETGAAICVDENGVEQPLPGMKFRCPVCYKETLSSTEFTDHVKEAHSPNKEVKIEQPIIVEPEKLVVPSEEDLRAKRLAAMAKGREAAKARREAEKNK